MFRAKDGKLYISGKRIGQLIITTEIRPTNIEDVEDVNSFSELMNKNLVTKEEFFELVERKDYDKLLFTPLYSKTYSSIDFFKNNVEGSVIDFDFIQIQGICIIYADGDNVRIIPENVDMETVFYYLRTKGINISDRIYVDDVNIIQSNRELLEKTLRSNGIDGELLKEYRVNGGVIYADDDKYPKIIDNVEFAVIYNNKVYGLIPSSNTILEYRVKTDKLYLNGLEVVVDSFSLCGQKILNEHGVHAVKIRHPFKKYVVEELFERTRSALITYIGDNIKVVREEDLRTVKYYKKLVLRKDRKSVEVARVLEKTQHNFHSRGTIFFKFDGRKFIVAGYGKLLMNFVVDKNRKKIYIPGKDKVFEFVVIRDTIEVSYYIG